MPDKQTWKRRAKFNEQLMRDLLPALAADRLALEAERDRTRDFAQRVEEENAALHTVLAAVRQALTGAITVDQLLEITDFGDAFDPYPLEGATT